MTRPNRRPLSLRDLDEVVREAESLHATGYERAGSWDLAQICGHLAEWLRFPLDGYPRQPLPLRLLFWGLRHTIAPSQMRKALARGAMSANSPTFQETVPPPGGDEAAAVARLREAVGRYQAHTGPFQPSPFFGVLDRETMTRLQLIHCNHHLSFLVRRG